jgi:hypothetical protein
MNRPKIFHCGKVNLISPCRVHHLTLSKRKLFKVANFHFVFIQTFQFCVVIFQLFIKVLPEDQSKWSGAVQEARLQYESIKKSVSMLIYLTSQF